jgi:hypothetical protein
MLLALEFAVGVTNSRERDGLSSLCGLRVCVVFIPLQKVSSLPFYRPREEPEIHEK